VTHVPDRTRRLRDDWVLTLDAALKFQDAHPEPSEPPGFGI
jgi:hypothetical protein